ncbi:MAG: hypothetical protein HYZ63_00510 [Candidatus Andersenbacteria bacterium]|nr:hypothetical protein [Candidatus Andersenbacteria bacterium]
MNQFLAACVALLSPLLFFFLPGAGIASVHAKRNLLAWVARVILWSVTASILATFITAALGFSSIVAVGCLTIILIGGLIINRKTFFTMPTAWYALAVLAGFLIVYTAFSVPYLLVRHGQPTGDAQKTIYWAQRIEAGHALPNYQDSLITLNRDPVDFFTPGLHTLAAMAMGLSPLPLTSIGFLAIAASICAAIIAAAIAKDIFDTEGKIFPATLVILLVLTNIRFVRYIREPGYHLQNIVGELLLFGLMSVGTGSYWHCCGGCSWLHAWPG